MKAENESNRLLDVKVKKPSFWLYTIPAYITRIFTKFYFKHKIDRSEMKKFKEPVVAISAHAGTFDIIVAIHSMMPMRLNVVTGRDLFTWPSLKPFIKAFGAIPKSQNAIDLQSMRTMKAAVDQGRNLLIYPEGKTSLDGKQLNYLSPTIGKFLKFLDCEVVMIKANGSYLTKPRYFHGFRRAKIVSKPYVLITKEELKTMSNKEVYEKVVDALKFNDHAWQQENNIRVKHKNLAANLNYILYKCPRCGSEYEMESDDRFLTCKHCLNKVEYTEYGELKPVGDSISLNRIDLWYDYEREEALKEFLQDGFYMSHEVKLFVEDQSTATFVERGEGIYFIDKEYVGFKGTKDGQYFEIKQPLNQLNTIITKNKEGVDMMMGDEIYRFLFKEHKWSSKYGNIIEMYCAHRNGLLK